MEAGLSLRSERSSLPVLPTRFPGDLAGDTPGAGASRGQDPFPCLPLFSPVAHLAGLPGHGRQRVGSPGKIHPGFPVSFLTPPFFACVLPLIVLIPIHIQSATLSPICPALLPVQRLSYGERIDITRLPVARIRGAAELAISLKSVGVLICWLDERTFHALWLMCHHSCGRPSGGSAEQDHVYQRVLSRC